MSYRLDHGVSGAIRRFAGLGMRPHRTEVDERGDLLFYVIDLHLD